MKKILLLFILLSTFLSWLNPFHYGIWVTAHSEFFMFFSLIILFLYLFFTEKKIIFYHEDLFFLLIALIPITQYIFGKIFFFGDAFITSVYICSFVLVLAIGRTLAISVEQREKSFILFAGVVIFSALVSFYAQLSQWFMFGKYIVFIAETPPNARPFANFSQPNTLATFYLLGVFSVVYLYEKSKINGLITALLLTILIFGIALTQSRTPWVFLLSFIIWWSWKGVNLNSTKVKSLYVYINSCIFILFTWLVPYLSGLLLLSAHSLEERITGGMARLNMWQQMLIAISNQPISGYGWQQVSNAQVATTLEFSHFEWTEHAHNILLDLLIWNGIPLGLVIIIGIGIWISKFINVANTFENFWFLCAVGAIIVHSMFEYPLEYAFFLIPTGFLLGLIQGSSQSVPLVTLNKKSLLITLVCGVVIYIIVLADYIKLEKDMMLARFEVLNIGDLHANHKAPDVILLTQLQAKIALMRTLPIANMSQVEQDRIYEMASRFATQGALIKYAQVLALNGDKKGAEDQLLILKKMHGLNLDYDRLLQLNNQKSLIYKWQNKEISQ